jgi:hypothetical protein
MSLTSGGTKCCWVTKFLPGGEIKYFWEPYVSTQWRNKMLLDPHVSTQYRNKILLEPYVFTRWRKNVETYVYTQLRNKILGAICFYPVEEGNFVRTVQWRNKILLGAIFFYPIAGKKCWEPYLLSHICWAISVEPYLLSHICFPVAKENVVIIIYYLSHPSDNLIIYLLTISINFTDLIFSRQWRWILFAYEVWHNAAC